MAQNDVVSLVDRRARVNADAVGAVAPIAPATPQGDDLVKALCNFAQKWSKQTEAMKELRLAEGDANRQGVTPIEREDFQSQLNLANQRAAHTSEMLLAAADDLAQEIRKGRTV